MEIPEFSNPTKISHNKTKIFKNIRIIEPKENSMFIFSLDPHPIEENLRTFYRFFHT